MEASLPLLSLLPSAALNVDHPLPMLLGTDSETPRGSSSPLAIYSFAEILATGFKALVLTDSLYVHGEEITHLVDSPVAETIPLQISFFMLRELSIHIPLSTPLDPSFSKLSAPSCPNSSLNRLEF